MTLRQKVIEAGAMEMHFADEGGRLASYYRELSEAALDAMLDCLTENADDAADVMAKAVGDYWTHQTRRALDGLVATLKGSS